MDKILRILFPMWYVFNNISNIKNSLEIISENNYELANQCKGELFDIHKFKNNENI